ncbi:hypothetical protein [Dyadobacter frigoris]|uniref:Uncharacterized protein n=1 Tax=Dyadobacter frigoris TaxID=2576211 RepID=A0A4U6CLV8_9BACT|nr:hypothetical protein [Dyadobacter frigoris]TKT85259.1 hypothetical protein FDK13_34265 [Dyadobacter frigoris]
MVISLIKSLPILMNKLGLKFEGGSQNEKELNHVSFDSKPLPPTTSLLPFEVFKSKPFETIGDQHGQQFGTDEHFNAKTMAIYEGFHASRIESMIILTRMIIREETVAKNCGQFDEDKKTKTEANIRFFRYLKLSLSKQHGIKFTDEQNDFSRILADYRAGYIAGRHKKSQLQSRFEQNGFGIFNN